MENTKTIILIRQTRDGVVDSAVGPFDTSDIARTWAHQNFSEFCIWDLVEYMTPEMSLENAK